MTVDLREGLEACPFCGGEVTLKEIDGDGEPAVAFVCAEGSTCKGSGLYIFARANNAEATAAWNRRSPALLAQARDAERYRWLREYNTSRHPEVTSAFYLGDENLDAAIDAALSQPGAGA